MARKQSLWRRIWDGPIPPLNIPTPTQAAEANRILIARMVVELLKEDEDRPDRVRDKILDALGPRWRNGKEEYWDFEWSDEEEDHASSRLIAAARLLQEKDLNDALQPTVREAEGEQGESWYWGWPEFPGHGETGTSRCEHHEYFMFLGKYEGRCTFRDKDGSVTEESGFYVNGKKVAD